MMTAVAIMAILGAESLTPTFDRALAAHEQGEFAEAIKIYEGLVAEGVVDADVFFNLGNAYAESDRLGPAIANYRRALSVRPGFDAAEGNLTLCIDAARRALAPPLEAPWRQALTIWSNRIPMGVLSGMLILFNAAFWGVLALRAVRPRPGARLALPLLAFLVVMCGVSVWARSHPLPITVASAPVVPVRFGTSLEDQIHFELYDGDQVAVEAQAGEWIRVRTVEGQRGWAPADRFASVTPPYTKPAPVESSIDDDV